MFNLKMEGKKENNRIKFFFNRYSKKNHTHTHTNEQWRILSLQQHTERQHCKKMQTNNEENDTKQFKQR